MSHDPSVSARGWSEDDSRFFIDYGRYFVPAREEQLALVAGLIPAAAGPFRVVDLCCGDGLLAAAVLDRHPAATVVGLDRSSLMLERASARLESRGERFIARSFDLTNPAWYRDLAGDADVSESGSEIRAVVSSLAVHHLDDAGKQQLFRDVHRLLAPGGALLLADLIAPLSDPARQAAADAWDRAVRDRAQSLDGHLGAFEVFEREKWNLYRYPDPTDQPSPLPAQLDWLDQAGFEDVEAFWLAAGHAVYGGYKSDVSS